jgi:hypothetical protein
MATTTTNFGWDIPQSTDLVKDGATAIAALGQDIDTAFVDLKGGTTGQILAKASNTDLDYSWITNDVGDITAVTAGTGISGGGTSGAVTITNSMATEIAAKGDLIVGTGSQTFDNLTAGSNYGFLQADSAQSTGLAWNNATWTTYSPTAAATSGTITSSTVAARYTRIGKLCVTQFTITITNNGTGAGQVYINAPFAVATHGGAYIGAFREAVATGKMGSITILNGGGQSFYCNFYDNTYPGGTNYVIQGTISYEVA